MCDRHWAIGDPNDPKTSKRFVQDVIAAVVDHSDMSPKEAARFIHNRTPLDANMRFDAAVMMHSSPCNTAQEYLERFGPRKS